MVTEILGLMFGFVVMVVGLWVAWESSVMVSERKARHKAGTHDYYDNPITPPTRKKGKVFDKSNVKYFDGDNT